MTRRAFPVLLLLVAVGCASPPEQHSVDPAATGGFPDQAGASSWRQWGGPTRDFKTPGASGANLATSWPEDGPPKLWSRPLGVGYSGIVYDRGALFTMYREGDDEVTIALRADDGHTIWEHRDSAPTREQHNVRFGKGPNATPLVLDDRLVTLGYTGILNCLDLRNGELLWSHHLIDDLGGENLEFGYSASPTVHDGAVIVLVGGESAVVAIDPQDGSPKWRSAAGSVSYASPIVIDVDGQQQIVYFAADAIHGIDADDGTALWDFPVVNEYRNNATSPIWGTDNLLWVATQLDGGTRVLRLSQSGGVTSVEEVWTSNRMSIHFWNALRLGDHVFASIGSQASILAGINILTGDIEWRQRGFTQANLLGAGERTILLDAEGQLALVQLSGSGVEVLAQTEIGRSETWTPPTLIETTLFVRDKQSIRALDLG